jgi:hypothetical protein
VIEDKEREAKGEGRERKEKCGLLDLGGSNGGRGRSVRLWFQPIKMQIFAVCVYNIHGKATFLPCVFFWYTANKTGP